MMTMAQHRFQKLLDDLAAPFSLFPWFNSRKPYRSFVDFVKKTPCPTLLRCTKEILVMDESSEAPPKWFLSASLRSTLLSIDPGMDCFDCNPECSKLTAKGLGDPLGVYGRVLAQQHWMEYQRVYW